MDIVCNFNYLCFQQKPTPNPSKEGNSILRENNIITFKIRRVNTLINTLNITRSQKLDLTLVYFTSMLSEQKREDFKTVGLIYPMGLPYSILLN
jgi:hypothetical protein